MLLPHSSSRVANSGMGYRPETRRSEARRAESRAGVLGEGTASRLPPVERCKLPHRGI